MASSTVITQAMLDIAAIPDASLSAMLVGKTVAVAADLLETIMALRASGQLIDNGAMVTYTIDNQTTTFAVAAVTAALAMMRALKNPGGGPVCMGIQLP